MKLQIIAVDPVTGRRFQVGSREDQVQVLLLRMRNMLVHNGIDPSRVAAHISIDGQMQRQVSIPE